MSPWSLWGGPVALFWLLVWVKTLVARRRATWRLGPDAPAAPAGEGVTVVVPARNEEANIGACVESLLTQDHPATRVVVLDDGSTDGTAEVLQRFGDRIRVIAGGDEPLPPGWKGKPWACQRAARDCEDPWVLFVDADVRLHPHAVAAAVGRAQAAGLDLLSGLGRLDMVSPWEKVLQPAVAGLILAGNDLDRVNDPARRSKRPLANGQFLLFRTAAYRAVGGHEAVRDNVVDDVGMAMAICGAGRAYGLFVMRELFRCRMYDSLGALWSGWAKNLYPGLDRNPLALVGVVTFLVLTNVAPYAVLAVGALRADAAMMAWGALTVALAQLARFTLDRTFEQDVRYGVTHGLGAILLIALLLDSARRAGGGVLWKGRPV